MRGYYELDKENKAHGTGAERWHRLRNIPEISKPFASAQSIPLMKGFDDNDACNARSIVEVGDTSRKVVDCDNSSRNEDKSGWDCNSQCYQGVLRGCVPCKVKRFAPYLDEMHTN